MLKVTEIAFCCYPVTDMARARKFYEGVLGLKPTTVTDLPEGKWVEYEFGPYTLSLGSMQRLESQPGRLHRGLEVEDFDAAIAQLRAQGVKFRTEPFPTPVCRMAFIFDPDGNTICIHKRNAK